MGFGSWPHTSASPASLLAADLPPACVVANLRPCVLNQASLLVQRLGSARLYLGAHSVFRRNVAPPTHSRCEARIARPRARVPSSRHFFATHSVARLGYLATPSTPHVVARLVCVLVPPICSSFASGRSAASSCRRVCGKSLMLRSCSTNLSMGAVS